MGDVVLFPWIINAGECERRVPGAPSSNILPWRHEILIPHDCQSITSIVLITHYSPVRRDGIVLKGLYTKLWIILYVPNTNGI